jgi:hypothetical protein
MKKQTKKSMTVKLDKECSRVVRSQGRCAWCGNTDYSKLQCCHIFSRTYRAVRWDLLNLLCLCAGCHFRGHKNPVLFTEFVKEYLGEFKYEELKIRATAIKKWTLGEMVDYYDKLKDIGDKE